LDTDRPTAHLLLRANLGYINSIDNDNDKRQGLTAKANQPDHKKYNTAKIK